MEINLPLMVHRAHPIFLYLPKTDSVKRTNSFRGITYLLHVHVTEKIILLGLTLLSCCLVYLAVPRFISSLESLYSNAVIQEISWGLSPSETTLLKSQEHLISAIEWVDNSLYWRQLSQLKLIQFTNNISKIKDIDQNIADLNATTKIALSLMPVAPYSWYDMALIDAMYPETADRAVLALKMSVYADRFNRNLIKPRVLFLWNNRELLDEELQAIFKSQLLLFWKLKRYELINFSKKNPEIEFWVFEILSDSPEELALYIKLL